KRLSSMINCMAPIINELLKTFKAHLAVEIDLPFGLILYWKRLYAEESMVSIKKLLLIRNRV
ncbi:MAG: hypothetical protein PHV74_08985, partial [Dehalococcoidia bacterium]|nr:hypothetical protein [Dehalococcoidia bacterium]